MPTRGEFRAHRGVVALGRLDQAEVSFTNKVFERQAVISELARDFDDEAQIRPSIEYPAPLRSFGFSGGFT